MSFNLNKLVQPECGGSNPLVSAAQQIAMKTTTPGSTSRLRNPQAPVNFAREFMQQKSHTASLAELSSQVIQTNQFINRQHANSQANPTFQNTQLAGTSSGQRLTSQGGKLATDFLMEHELSEGLDRINMVGSSQSISAGPSRSYLPSMMDSNQMMGYGSMRVHQPVTETMSNQENINMTSAGDQLETKYRNDMISQNSQKNNEKLDDVAFWQNLSQKYIGPNTYDNIAKMKLNESKSKTIVDEAKVVVDEEKLETEREGELFTTPADAQTSFDRRQLDLEYAFDERNPLKDQFEDPFTEGLKRLEQGDIPSAVLLFEAAVQLKPDDSVAWRYLGTTQAQNENDHSAIRALRNCLNLNQNDQQARLAISVSLANETEHHEACEHLLEWLIRHEKYKSIGASLEEFHKFDSELSNDPFYINSVDQKHYNYVRDKFVDAARLSPSNPDPEVQSSLGVLFNIRGEYTKAVDCFKAALSVKADDSVLWNRLGATLANGNKSDEAVIAYRKALEISPGFLRSRYNLAISLVHLNIYDEAAKQLVQILNMQAAGKGSKNTQIRTRSITSLTIWNTLRTVATLLNKPELYPIIDGRNLARCNEELLKPNQGISESSSSISSD